MLKRLVAVLVVMAAVRLESVAQGPIDLRVGIRGGWLSDSTPLEFSSHAAFGPRRSGSASVVAFGPAVGVLFGDHVEFRFEATRHKFHLEERSGTPYPASGVKGTSVTDGHVWQYPVMVAYHFKSRLPFVTGGFTPARTIAGMTRTEYTTNLNPNNVETTTITTGPFRPPEPNPMAFNFGAGIDVQKRWISLRPEMRFGFWTGYRMLSSGSQVLFSPTQVELIIGLQVHPFSHKRVTN